jgi:LIM homeobox protein 2/9
LLDTSSSNGALNLTENTSGVYCANNSNGYYDSVAAVAAAAAAAAAAAQRQKRMRTSFKHHQLRVMKSYFELNHNPDAKDLKQLSQKTGLSKRVLQVWFQNARAKFRRGQSNPNESQDQQSPQTSINNSQNVSSSSSTSSSTDLNTSIQQHGHHQQLGLDIIDENSSQSLKDQLSSNNNSSGLDQSYIMLNGNSASSYHHNPNHQPIHNHIHHQSMIHHNHHTNMMSQSQFQYMMQPAPQQQLNAQTADFNSNGLMVDNLLL